MRLRISFICACAAAPLLLGGCATQLGAPVASAENIAAVRSARLGAVDVGNFNAAPGKESALDGPMQFRGVSASAPTGGSFSKYLRETLIVELKAAGIYATPAPSAVSGVLTASEADTGISEGTGKLSARFVVTRGGQSVYDKELSVASRWASSFVGAVAIPAAMNEYTLLYRKLVGALLNDPEFHRAVRAD